MVAAPPEPPPAADHTEVEAGASLSPLARKLILAGVATTTLVGTLGVAFLPYLIVEHPALLLLTSSDGRNLVLAAAKLDPFTVLAIAVPRRVLAMVVTWGLGMLYGRKLLGWTGRKLPSIGRALTWLEGLFRRYRRTLLVLWPTYTTAVLAGVANMSWRLFLPWVVVGQIGYVAISYVLGDALSAWITQGIAWLSLYVWEATALCVALVAVQQLVALVRRRRAAPAFEG
jgi:hypothetical protein